MKKRIAVVVGFLLLVAGAFADDVELAKKLNKEGVALYNKGDIDGALEKFLLAEKEYGDTKDYVLGTICLNIASSYEKLGDLEKLAFYLENGGDCFYESLDQQHEDYLVVSVENWCKAAQIYYSIGKFKNTIFLYEKCISIWKDLTGVDNEPAAVIFNQIGSAHLALRENDIALDYFEKSLALAQKHCKDKKEFIAVVNGNIGLAYLYKGEYEKAEEYLKNSALIYESVLGPDSDNVALAYNNIGLARYEVGKYQEALKYFNKALKISEKNNPEGSALTANILGCFAALFSAQSHYNESVDYTKKQIAIIEKIKGKTHPDLLFAYNNLGAAYCKKEDYENALLSYNEALEIQKKNFGLEQSFAAVIYNNIGQAYASKPDYDNAIDYSNKALKVSLKTNGENHALTGQIYNNLASLYEEKGMLDIARPYLEKALQIRTECLGENHPDTAQTYINMGFYYSMTGDYDRAIAYYEKALNVYIATTGSSKETAECYNNVAIVYADKGNYKKAIDYYNKVVEIYKKVFEGKASAGLALAYNNIGYSYYRAGDSKNAEENFLKAINIQKEIADIPTPKLAHYIANYANTIKDYEQSVKLFEEAIDIYNNIYGLNNSFVIKPYQNLGIVYERYGYKDKAVAAWKKAAAAIKASEVDFETVLIFSQNAVYLENSDLSFKREILDLCLQKLEQTRLSMSSLKTEITRRTLPLYYYGVHFEAEQKNPARAFEYSEALRSRGFLDQIGTAAAMRLDGVGDEDREKLQSLMVQIESSRHIISSQSTSEGGVHNSELVFGEEKKLKEAEQQLSDLDAALSKKVPKYAQLRNPKPATAKEAQKWCGKKRAVLEYVLWDQSLADPKKKAPDINSYCIVITEKGVDIVPLDTEGFDYEDDINEVIRLVERKNKIIEGGNFEKRLASLYEFLVAPVEEYIKGAEELVIVPDGALFKLPFDLLKKDSSSETLGDKYAVTLSPSVSVSIIADAVKNKSGRTLAIGAAWYDKRLSEKEHARVFSDEKFAKEYIAKAAYPNDLPGSYKEIDRLKRTAFKSKPFDVVVQQDATEKKIKDLSSNKRLSEYSAVLFSGHGEFDKSGKSGILFSETSGLFEVEQTEQDDAIDGRLTVGEVALLNLNAEMFMLSACQTGLGEVENGDGFTGLVRAFMVAGCKNVGASLWKVDDEATAEFMARIFDKVQNKKVPYAQAYKETKAEFRKMEKWSAPYYWAAFVLWE